MTKYKMIHIFAVLLMLSMLLASCKPAETPATTTTGTTEETAVVTEAPLELYNLRILVAGDMPPDQQKVLDEVEARTRDTLNIDITVDYIPWGDYIEKVRLMSAAGEKFDICLTFSGVFNEAYSRKEMLALDDLLAQYGPNLLEKIDYSNWAWAKASDGKTVAIPAQYAKDGIYNFLVRKDLREKYNCAEIVDMATLSAYLDALVANEPGITPLWGWGGAINSLGLAGAVEFENLRLFNPNFDYGYEGQGYRIGFWETTGADAYVVKNWYADARAQNYIKWGAKAMNSGWYSRDLNAGAEFLPTTACASGQVGATTLDYYNYNAVVNATKEITPDAVWEWVMINKGAPVSVATCNNFAQISASSEDPARAVMFLDWIQASQENYDLWNYGIEGVHYTLGDDGSIVYPEGSVSTALPYAPTPWYYRNKNYDRSISTDSDVTKAAQKYFKDVKTYDLPDTALFSFDITNVESEITQVGAVINEYWPDLMNGVLQGDDKYQKFLTDLDASGMQTVLTEMQTQLDAWRAANLK